MITGIMIDQREPDWVKALKFGGAPVMVSTLDAGDVWATTDDGAMLCIERKTATDLLNSIKDDRLFTQIHGMRQRTPWAYLVIDGAIWPDRHGFAITEAGSTHWNWSSVQGALLQAQEMGAFVCWAGTEDFENTIIRLGARGRGAIKVRHERETLTVSVAEQILTALPGIGDQRAAAILKYAGTAGWALCYLTDPEFDKEIDGIGTITKRKIREALQLADGEVISVIGKDGHPVAKSERKAA